MNGYKECPHPDCQGLIAPTDIAVTRWQRERTGLNLFGMRRIHYIYCETCGRGFEYHETESSRTPPKFQMMIEPDKVRALRQRIAQLNGTGTKGLKVNCYA